MEPNEVKPPTDWRVKDGVFIGYVLVQTEVQGNTQIRSKKMTDDWLAYAVHLSDITSIKQDGRKNMDQTALYHGNDFVGTVNVPFHMLVEPWSKARTPIECTLEETCLKDPMKLNLNPNGTGD